MALERDACKVNASFLHALMSRYLGVCAHVAKRLRENLLGLSAGCEAALNQADMRSVIFYAAIYFP